MAQTLPGGAYLSSDNKTWHDANGNPIPAPAEQSLKAAEVVTASAMEPAAPAVTVPAVEPPSRAPQKAKEPK